MIKTKSIYDPIEESDGTRILVTRLYPRGVKKSNFDAWWKELSPSKELVKSYKAGDISQEEFKKQFVSQIKSDETTKKAIEQLGIISLQKTVTILCYEKEGVEFCHRYVVRDWALGNKIKPAKDYIIHATKNNQPAKKAKTRGSRLNK